ncbi:hypothetical protein [Bradyrhizobium algeriense]|uniref:hypothetical protein n=1 Tax=Bradyrhizobium algeriense TaxID=634784 RepID=UPI000D3843E0|nr:hypothetical protein [Bradyrhizobium algeriense]
MSSFRIMSTMATVIAIAFACGTSVFSYLAWTSATLPACAELNPIGGYRSAASDFWALPLFSALVAIVVEKSRKDRRTFQQVKDLDVTIFELSGFRVTFGMFLVYSVLFGTIAISAIMTSYSAMRYAAISTQCG